MNTYIITFVNGNEREFKKEFRDVTFGFGGNCCVYTRDAADRIVESEWFPNGAILKIRTIYAETE